MPLLLIDTCGTQGLVALADEHAVLGELALPGRGAGEAMLPALRELFSKAGITPAQLTAVAVVDGPGSFTGVRVGLSAAKGMAEAVGCGLVAISRLWLLAGGLVNPALALLDAGRGEVFCGWWEGERWTERLLTAESAAKLLSGRMGVCCEPRIRALLGDEVMLTNEPSSEAIRLEARLRVTQGTWTDCAAADANYLRRTDAELLEERLQAQG